MPDRRRTYMRLFKIDKNYLTPGPETRRLNFTHLASARSAIRHLGYVSNIVPNDEVASDWVTYLNDICERISDGPPMEPIYSEDAPPSSQAQGIIDPLLTYRRAAIVGVPESHQAL